MVTPQPADATAVPAAAARVEPMIELMAMPSASATAGAPMREDRRIYIDIEDMKETTTARGSYFTYGQMEATPTLGCRSSPPTSPAPTPTAGQFMAPH
ncbi:MAG: hypothetical protein IPK16_30525 [Anaerolineales bacterium]|nr:hypothetical protein [Anaerolineales bacterium]